MTLFNEAPDWATHYRLPSRGEEFITWYEIPEGYNGQSEISFRYSYGGSDRRQVNIPYGFENGDLKPIPTQQIPAAKDVLEAGKHMIVFSDGRKALYLHAGVVVYLKGDGIRETTHLAGWDLIGKLDQSDILSIYQIKDEYTPMSGMNFSVENPMNIELVWDRESYEKQQEDQEKALQKKSEYDKLMKQIDDLKKQAEKLK